MGDYGERISNLKKGVHLLTYGRSCGEYPAVEGLGREIPWLSFHPRPDTISGEPEARKVLFVGRVAKLEDAVELSWSSIRPRQQIGI